MLILPVLLGVAASRPAPWQAVLFGAAVSGYLLSATLQSWSRARRAPAYRAPLAVYGAAFAIVSLVLVVAFPPLLLVLVVAVPTAAIVFEGARPGTKRDLANSLAQVVQALALVPATAFVAGEPETGRVVAYTLVAAGYLFGSVLVVRSVLRERANAAFAGLSVGFHGALVIVALVGGLPAYAVVAGWLTLRAAALPCLQRRWARGPRPLRPVHAGIVEIISSVAVVVVSFAVPL